MRILILVFLFVWTELAFSQGADSTDEISDEVKAALYEEGMQAAVDVIDSLNSPTADEHFLVLFLVREHEVKTSKLEYHKNSNYKESESYKLDFYLNNFLDLNENESIDLKRLAKNKLLAESFLYFKLLIESPRFSAMYKRNDIPFHLYSMVKDEVVYKTFSAFVIGISAFDEFHSGDCVGLNLGSISAFWIYKLYGKKGFVNCEINTNDFDMFSIVLPMNFEPEILISLENSDVDKIYWYWYERKSSSIYLEESVESECDESGFDSTRGRKLCFLMALGAADYCSLPFWSEFDTKVKVNDRWVSRRGWVKTDKYKECKINYIKEHIGSE